MTRNIKQVWDDSVKLMRWRELLPGWIYFLTNEPMHSAILGRELNEESKESLSGLLQETLSYDDLPVIVAWDTANNKVSDEVNVFCIKCAFFDMHFN